MKELIVYKDVEICQDEQIVLTNVNLTISSGEMVYLLGRVGSGKSSLMKTIYGELPVQGDKADALGYDLLKIKRKQIPYLRRKVGVVFQDFQIYATTIAENILMRRIENDQDVEGVLNALEKVGLKEKVLNLPRGIYTPVTREFDRDGISFSGGERQRLVIARVFASNRDIYILDEPTSSLDPLAEEKINKLIMNQDKEKTMIIIAHRLSTVVDADIIYLIRKGKIIEKGKHEELMKLKGQYSIMFNAQKHLYESK